ncbi:MAG: pyridoxal-phosphate dependent enzyme [Bacteroidetes bacterium]|nr:pyridoxal-phosphate dependent enzyme [Bacteroidota bacterium]
MQDINLNAITTDRLTHACFTENAVEASMLRLDKIHPLISGNKWFKLRYYLEEAKQQHKKKIVTFGGAWSNHIMATAAACRLHQLECTGIIRGEKPPVLSQTLQQAASLGMQLVFISREKFSDSYIPDELKTDNNYIIPQGGYGEPGAKGAAGILRMADKKNTHTHVCCAAGTGTMLAGLVHAASPEQKVIGISVLKNNYQLEKDVAGLLKEPDQRFSVLHDYHFGGYAKCSTTLIQFMNGWYRQTNIPLDFVYTAKLCFAAMDLAGKKYFPGGSRILLIHSGGLTGNASLKKGTLIF